MTDSAQPIKDCDSDRSKPIGVDPLAYEGDIVSRLRHWRHRHLAHCGELFEAAADEIERLRTIMYRIVDEDCTVAIQNGTFYADDEPLFAISGATKPRNGAVRGPDPDSRVWETPRTPARQTTPSECSTRGMCSAPDSGIANEPVAWAVIGKERLKGHVIGLHDTALEAHVRVGRMVSYGEIFTADKVEVVPLYRHHPCQDFSQKNLTLTDAEREALEVACQDLRHAEEVATLRGLLERMK